MVKRRTDAKRVDEEVVSEGFTSRGEQIPKGGKVPLGKQFPLANQGNEFKFLPRT